MKLSTLSFNMKKNGSQTTLIIEEVPTVTPLTEQLMTQVKGGYSNTGPKGADKRKRPTGG